MYQKLIKGYTEREEHVILGGRLGNYQYYDMDKVIASALETVRKELGETIGRNMAYLMTVPELEFFDEVDCVDLFPGVNPRERILIFQVL